MSEIVIHTNSSGYKEFRRVPSGSSPTTYHQGIVIGPVDISSLPLTAKQRKELNNFLVDNGISSYKNLLGNKRAILKFLTDLGLKELKAVEVRNSIIGLYQGEILELTM